MKISTRGRYALRIMLDIAIHDDENPVSFKDVSARQGISVKYMEQIGSMLTRAGFLKGVRGSQGGYHLVKKASEYTIGDILRVTEGPLNITPCMEEGGSCDMTGNCLTYPFWAKLNDAITEVVDGTTLQDLIDDYNRNEIISIGAGI